MRICDLQTGMIRLTKSAKRLRDQWEMTRPHWEDRNAAEFEKDHFQDLTPQLTLVLAAVNRLAAVLELAERDCWDEDRENP